MCGELSYTAKLDIYFAIIFRFVYWYIKFKS